LVSEALTSLETALSALNELALKLESNNSSTGNAA